MPTTDNSCHTFRAQASPITPTPSNDTSENDERLLQMAGIHNNISIQKRLGIYKSLVQYDKLATQPNKQNKDSSPDKCHKSAETAILIQLHLINLAIRHAHTLERWTRVHNIFIEKLPGQPLIDKLRVIHIYEADWNLLLKFFVSFKLTHIACQQHTVTPERAGGRLGPQLLRIPTTTIE
jgi:hypothetical protein